MRLTKTVESVNERSFELIRLELCGFRTSRRAVGIVAVRLVGPSRFDIAFTCPFCHTNIFYRWNERVDYRALFLSLPDDQQHSMKCHLNGTSVIAFRFVADRAAK